MGYNVKNDCKSTWSGEKTKLTEDILEIAGHPVMERWETPYMNALAEIATSKGGDVLEVGFGMGISAGFVQQNTINSHTIIEANDNVYEKLCLFAKDAKNTVIPKKGLWQDVVATLEEKSFDGILYDTYPLSEEDMHQHQFSFLKNAYKLLKDDGVLTYCNLTSWGNLRGKYETDKEFFELSQLPHLKEIGFSNIEYKTISVTPDESCKYYQHATIVAPVIRK
jgi:guanidinoacetate N-methyltransferase